MDLLVLFKSLTWMLGLIALVLSLKVAHRFYNLNNSLAKDIGAQLYGEVVLVVVTLIFAGLAAFGLLEQLGQWGASWLRVISFSTAIYTTTRLYNKISSLQDARDSI